MCVGPFYLYVGSPNVLSAKPSHPLQKGHWLLYVARLAWITLSVQLLWHPLIQLLCCHPSACVELIFPTRLCLPGVQQVSGLPVVLWRQYVFTCV